MKLLNLGAEDGVFSFDIVLHNGKMYREISFLLSLDKVTHKLQRICQLSQIKTEEGHRPSANLS